MIALKRASRLKQLTKSEDYPNPEEIRQMTAVIRSTWTRRERCRRANIVDGVEVVQMPLQPRRKGFWGD